MKDALQKKQARPYDLDMTSALACCFKLCEGRLSQDSGACSSDRFANTASRTHWHETPLDQFFDQ